MWELKRKGREYPDRCITGIYGLYNEDMQEWIYIGKSVDIGKRIQKHSTVIYKLSASSFQSNTYRNIRNFTAGSYCNWYILKECSNKELTKAENHYIKALKPIANST